jgi:hypothetical protein
MFLRKQRPFGKPDAADFPDVDQLLTKEFIMRMLLLILVFIILMTWCNPVF